VITGKSPRPEKVKKVQEIREKIAKATAVILTKFEGITSGDMMDLRAEIRKNGLEMKVYKNTLIRIAFEEEGYEDIPAEAFKYTTAMIFAYDDPVVAAKLYKDMRKQYDVLEPKLLILEGRVFGPEKVEQLAEMPSREQALAMVAAAFAAPLKNMASVLQAPVRDLANVLQALKNKKEEEGA